MRISRRSQAAARVSLFVVLVFLIVPVTALASPSSSVGRPATALTHEPSNTPSSTNTAPGTHCNNQPATILGTEGDDELIGTPDHDVIHALGGDDVIRGLGADDFVCGDDGDDIIEAGEGNADDASEWISGGAGNDALTGSSTKDFIDGGSGDDLVIAGDGDDYIRARDGVDEINAGDGNDIVSAGHGDDFAHGDAGNDQLFGSEGLDELHGDSGNDQLSAFDDTGGATGAGDDLMVGGDGDDLVQGGPGNDRLDAGVGNDTLKFYEFGEEGVSVDLASGTASGRGEDMVIGFENVGGTPYTDTLIGTDDANLVIGGEGDDVIESLDGDDTIYADSIGCGSSTPHTANSDQINGGSGDDWIQAGHQCGGADGNDIANGEDGNDEILGGAGDDQLTGGPGDDDIKAMSGVDTVDGGDGSDRCTEAEELTSCEDTSPASDCDDGYDNEGDNSVDFPDDPGCVSASDDYEGFPPEDPHHGGGTNGVFLRHDIGTKVFRGSVLHTEDRCIPDRNVTLHRVEKGDDPRIGRVRADAQGIWRIRVDRVPRERYYATAAPSTFTTDGGDVVRCPRLFSRSVFGLLLPQPKTKGLLGSRDIHCESIADVPAWCVTFLTIDPDRETDQERDYGFVWAQTRVRPPDSRYCTKRYKAIVKYPRSVAVRGVDPEGTKRVRRAQILESRVDLDLDGNLSSVSERWKAYPGRLAGQVNEERHTISLEWKGVRFERMMLIHGAVLEWDPGSPPTAQDFVIDRRGRFTIRRLCV